MGLIEEICKKDLRKFLEENGHEFKGKNTLCPFHEDRQPSMSVYQKDDGSWHWYCHSCQEGGTILNYMMKKYNLQKQEAIEKLADKFNLKNTGRNSKVIDEYPYQDEEGKELFRVVRFEPKAFRVKRMVNNSWEWDKKGIREVLYNLPEVIKSETVWLVEGEKDVENLKKIGIVATTNPFGVNHWNSEYATCFKDKKVIICLDKGCETESERRAERILKAGAKEVKIVELPGLSREGEDISDWIEMRDAQDKESLKSWLERIATDTPIFEIPGSMPKIKNDFLNLYVESISRSTDAAEIFILFSGIGLLSGILNKFYFKYPRVTPLNLYILLLAPSTFCRKTVCLDIASDYLIDTNESLYLPESFTAEALYPILEKQNRGLVIWRELNQVKEFQMAAEYNRGLPAFLTDIYDFKKMWKRRTKGEGEIIIREPIISILAAGVTTWFTENLKKIDFEGGLWTRFLFVPAPEEEKKFHLPKSFTLNKEILEQLKRLDELAPEEISISKIESLIEEWGSKHLQQAQKLSSGILQALFLRMEGMLLKLAAIFQLSHNQSKIIEPDTFREAVKVIEYLKRKMVIFFEEEIHFSEFEKDKARVLKYIKKKKNIQYKFLLRNLKMKAKYLIEILDQLQEEGEIYRRDKMIDCIGQN